MFRRNIMGTSVRPEISRKNKYWISKHQYYELKHFCLQYPEWTVRVKELDTYVKAVIMKERVQTSGYMDPTAEIVNKRSYFTDKIELVERIAGETDDLLKNYILKAVTEGISFEYLKARLEIPCGRDMYYDRYRRFFWLLSKER